MQPGQVSADPLTKSRWTLEYMTALTALNEDFNLAKGTPGRGERIGRIFRRVFRIDLGTTHTTDLSNKKILDYYDSRHQKGRNQDFKDVIEAVPSSALQQARTAKVLPLLRRAIVDEGLGSVVVERNLPVAVQSANEEDEEDENGEEEVDETNKEVVKMEPDGEYDQTQSHRSRRHAKRSRSSEVQPSEPLTKRSRTSRADDASGIRDSLVDQYGEGVVVKAESSNRETAYSRAGREVKPTEKLQQTIKDGNRKAHSSKTNATTTDAPTNGLIPSLPEAPSQHVDVWNTLASSEHIESTSNATRPESGGSKDQHSSLKLMHETMPHLTEMMKKTAPLEALEQTSSAQVAEKVGGQVDTSSSTGPLQFVGSASLALQQYFAPQGSDFEDTHLFDLEVWAIETGYRDAELEMQGSRLDGQGYGITDPIEGDNGFLNNGHRFDLQEWVMETRYRDDDTDFQGGQPDKQGHRITGLIFDNGLSSNRLLGMQNPASVPTIKNNGMPLMSPTEMRPFQNLHSPQAASKSEQTPANNDSPYFNNDQKPYISTTDYEYITQTPSITPSKPKYMFDTTASPRRENESTSEYSWRVVHRVVRVDGHGKIPATPTDATNPQVKNQLATIGDINNRSSTPPTANGPYVPTTIDGYMMPSNPPQSYVERQRRQREAELMAFINADPEIQRLDAERLLRDQADLLAQQKVMPPQLPMIHFREYDGPEVTAINPPKLMFVDQSTATYELGGRVRRVFALIAGGHQDVMMCNMAICGYCKDAYTPTATESMEMMVREAQRTEGLPFVHSTDCFQSSAGDWHYFPDVVRPYKMKYPQMKRTNVIFTVKDSKEGTPAIETMMCDMEHCEDCKSKRDEEMHV
ncbi:hypothetical protein LTS10_012035 [Elasticomyces elasticus]|nr:hypothetical protein LTS10_012035 [Elasticomyces elasticus]